MSKPKTFLSQIRERRPNEQDVELGRYIAECRKCGSKIATDDPKWLRNKLHERKWKPNPELTCYACLYADIPLVDR